MKDKDKEEIRKIVQDELKLALCRKITIERGPSQQGDPEKVIKEEEWNVLDFMAAYAPRIEAALRGMQADVDRTKNKVLEQNAKIDVIGLTLLGLEKSARKLAGLSDSVGVAHKLLEIRPGYESDTT
jgi:hypothetical protein